MENPIQPISEDNELDYFTSCPDDIKLEIVSMLTEPQHLCTLSLVSKDWYLFMCEDRIWKKMFFRDFQWWTSQGNEHIKLKEGQSWRSLYAEYFLKGWQWDPAQSHSRIVLTNNNFSVSLTSGYSYHGVRTLRGEQNGKHYFEVLIEPAEDNKKFDRGTTIFMGIGLANSTFNVENCCSGWTRDNSGIGYYNDGQIYSCSERYFGKLSKVAFHTGDRVGMEFDLDEGFVQFYLNGCIITEKIHGIKKGVVMYPHLILANDIKQRITITTGRRVTHSQAHSPYSNALATLESMGFGYGSEIYIDLLSQYNGDVERVVNELLV